jgi:hypothetical protein
VKLKRVDPDDKSKLWMPKGEAHVCSNHFVDSDYYMQWGRKLLNANEVPTVFSFKSSEKKRRKPLAPRNIPSKKAKLENQNLSVPSSTAAEDATKYDLNTAFDARSSKTVLHDDPYSVGSPKKLCATVKLLASKLKTKNVALHNSRRREQSLKARADSLLNEVKRLRLLSTETETLISSYDNMPVRLFDHRQGTPFSDEQKHFATTMHFYSPAAYEFLRKQFQTLPSPRTIRSWLSSYDGRPGLTEQSFETISNAINGSQGWQYKLCCLHMDEMEMKKHVLDYDKRSKKMFGFTDIGNGPIDADSSPQAIKVLMILAVGLAGSWRLPVAYYLTNGTNADLQATILKSVISKLWEAGLLVVTITFDGLQANQKTVELLGGSMNPADLKSSFTHPDCADYSAGIVFDACHMMKLSRNLLCEHQELSIPGVGRAKWQHFEQLHKFQSSEGLRSGNKLTKAHMNHKTQKMKVRVAVQLFSLKFNFPI